VWADFRFNSFPDESIHVSGFSREEFNNVVMTTLLNYRTQHSSLLKPDTQIDSSGKLLNFKCAHTTLTEKMA